MDHTASCPCSGRFLHKLHHPAILAILAEGELHGFELVNRLGDLGGGRGTLPDTAGVYRHLHAMERDGYVRGRWRTPAAGPAQRGYQLTESGRACLQAWVETLEEYLDFVAEVKASVERATSRPPANAR